MDIVKKNGLKKFFVEFSTILLVLYCFNLCLLMIVLIFFLIKININNLKQTLTLLDFTSNL